MTRLWRAIKCNLGLHSMRLERMEPGVKTVERCRNCPHSRVRYVGARL